MSSLTDKSSVQSELCLSWCSPHIFMPMENSTLSILGYQYSGLLSFALFIIVLRTIYGSQFILSTQVIKPNYLLAVPIRGKEKLLKINLTYI